jgi:exosortase C (VPDSG-CTERM-specific)
MPPPEETLTPKTILISSTPVSPTGGQLQRFVMAAGALTLCFSLPLYQLVRFALGSDLFSHIPLIPLVSAYLVWLRRKSLPTRFAPDPAIATIPLIFGALALAGYWLAIGLGMKLPTEDRLALTTSSYLLLLLGVGGWIFGRELLKALVFPLAMLVFAVPMPVFLVDGIETFLQHGSAEVVAVLFSLAGTPVFRQDLVFQLPGITLKVAQECSGIHSTLALFITSLLAGHLFLRSPLARTVVTLAVVPLALIRNGFRVFVIGELCVHISPDMIHSYIHRQGGPIFFALSLVPFGLLLAWLRRIENRDPAAKR